MARFGNLYHLALKILLLGRKHKQNRRVVVIASAVFIVAVLVMLVSNSILAGFKHTIESKVLGFSSHVSISKLDGNNNESLSPIIVSEALQKEIDIVNNSYPLTVEPSVVSVGIITTDSLMHGIVFKGVTENGINKYLKEAIIKGRLPNLKDKNTTKEVVISKFISDILRIDTADRFTLFFKSESLPIKEKFKVVGIYQTHLSIFDESFILGDIRLARKINGWHNNEVASLELLFNNTYRDYLSKAQEFAIDRLGFVKLTDTTYTFAVKSQDKYPSIYDWLSMQDINILILEIIMLFIVIFSIITMLLIVTIDSIKVVNIFKILGIRNENIFVIFLVRSLLLFFYNVSIALLLWLVIVYLQSEFNLITLDPNIYFIDSVPIEYHFTSVLFSLSWIFLTVLLVTLFTIKITYNDNNLK